MPLLNVSVPEPVLEPVTDTVAEPLFGWQVDISQTAFEKVVVTVKFAIACSTEIEPEAIVRVEAEVSVVMVKGVGVVILWRNRVVPDDDFPVRVSLMLTVAVRVEAVVALHVNTWLALVLETAFAESLPVIST